MFLTLPGRRAVTVLLAAAAAVLTVAGPAGAVIPDGTRFYTPRPDHDAIRQIAELRAAGQKDLADDIRTMIRTPQAIWVTGGSGRRLTQSVRAEAHRAAAKHRMPVLVAYNLPFRDCAQYSAGGAADTWPSTRRGSTASPPASAGSPAAVILEPDGLGHHPVVHQHQRRRRVVPAGRGGPRHRRQRPLRAAQLRGRRASRRCRGPASTSTARTARGWASATSPTGW